MKTKTAVLLYRLLNGAQFPSKLTSKLRWYDVISDQFDGAEDLDEIPVLALLAQYYNERKAMPANTTILKNWAANSNTVQSCYSPEQLKAVLDLCNITPSDEQIDRHQDVESIFDSTFQEDLAAWETRKNALCEDALTTARDPKNPEVFGQKAAEQLRRRLDKYNYVENGSAESVEAQFTSSETTGILSQYLTNLRDGKKLRVRTGIPEIDNFTAMKRGQSLIVAGYLGHGKTTFTLSLIYEMAKSGMNILYNSMEASSEEILWHLAFLYIDDNREELGLQTLRDRRDFDQGEASIEDVKKFESIYQGLSTGANLPGKIYVFQEFNWESVKAKYEELDSTHNFDVLVVDYINTLAVEKEGREDENQAKARQAVDIVLWARQQKKFLFISPFQTGNTKMNEADKHYERTDDNPRAYNESCLDWGKEVAQSVDHIWSVFSNSYLVESKEMYVQCHKARSTDRFNNFHAKFRPQTKRVVSPMNDLGFTPTPEARMQAVDDIDFSYDDAMDMYKNMEVK